MFKAHTKICSSIQNPFSFTELYVIFNWHIIMASNASGTFMGEAIGALGYRGLPPIRTYLHTYFFNLCPRYFCFLFFENVF